MAKEKKVVDAPFATPEMLARIHKVIGQCEGIERMVKSGRQIENIMLQISAIRSALQRLGQVLLEAHIESNVKKAVEQGKSADAAFEDIAQAIDYFCRTK